MQIHLVAVADLSPLSIAPKPPTPLLLQPQNGAALRPGQELTLLGQAFDWDEGSIPADSLVWSIDGREIARGASAPVSDLETGIPLVSLTATNSFGLPAHRK